LGRISVLRKISQGYPRSECEPEFQALGWNQLIVGVILSWFLRVHRRNFIISEELLYIPPELRKMSARDHQTRLDVRTS
jgi:hypothetical protein